jgi:hypothetical protein
MFVIIDKDTQGVHMSTSENIANSVNSVLKGYYQQLVAGNKGIFLIYPVDERGQPVETLWADNLNGQPVFLNQNNGWHNRHLRKCSKLSISML